MNVAKSPVPSSNAGSKSQLRESPGRDDAHEPHWFSKAAFPVLTLSLAFCQVAIWFSLYYNNYWLVVPLALLTSHIMHGNLIGFHEASHGMLRKNRLLNELDGVLIGIISLTSFSLYRAAHQTHHAHLSTARDEEFWPFVEPSTPRWFRVLAAVLELSFGLFVTPMVFLRTFLRKGTPIRSRKVRRRIWAELILIASIWVTVVSLVAWTGTWKYFFWMYLIPGFIAGNLQAWRKYIEHVGLTGATIRSATRSIVADTLMGRVVSFTLLHEPFHGVHHQKAGLGHAELPFYRADLQPVHEDDHPPFPSYRHALIHLLGTLKDPRVGAQWRTDAATASRRA